MKSIAEKGIESYSMATSEPVEITIDDDDDDVTPSANVNDTSSNTGPISKCTFCSYQTKAGDATLKTHILALHQNAAPKTGGAVKTFQCPFCKFSATQKINLHNHIVASHQINSKPQKVLQEQKDKLKPQTSIPFQSIHKPTNGVQSGPKLSLFAQQKKVVPAKMPIIPFPLMYVNTKIKLIVG